MQNIFSFRTGALLCGAALCTAFAASAQELPSEGPVPTQVTISAESKQPVTLDPAQIKIEVNGHTTPLASLTPVSPSSLQVAILIDDGLRSSFNVQIRDIQQFLQALPSGAQVLVGYMRNGTVVSDGGFTADHAAAAAQLRIPTGIGGVNASPYFCLSDFVKHWPAQGSGSRSVLMLTNGVDPYNGSVSITNQDSPYVQQAQEDAQRAGVAVYSIYYGDRGARGGAAALSGQSYLIQVAHATGGRSFYIGDFNPVSLQPFLSEFAEALRESYTASFMVSANREKPSTLVRFKASTSQPGVKVHAPDDVHPGLATNQQ